MSQQKIFKEIKKNKKKEKTKEYVDFSKQIKKWKQVRNTFLKSKREYVKGFFLVENVFV